MISNAQNGYSSTQNTGKIKMNKTEKPFSLQDDEKN